MDASGNTDEDSEEEKEETKPKQAAPVDPMGAINNSHLELITLEKYRKFVTRSVWGGLMIAVFAFILYMGHAAVSLFVILIQIMIFKEMLGIRYKEAKERKLWGFRTLHWFVPLIAKLFLR